MFGFLRTVAAATVIGTAKAAPRAAAPAPTSGYPDSARPKASARAAAVARRHGGKLAAGTALAALCCTTIAGFEGMRTSAYRDVVGIPTVCVGETKGIRMGMTFGKPECEAMLLKRLTEDFAPAMESCVTRPMGDDTYAAFLSLSYNVGSSAFCGSTVVRKFNAGDGRGACDAVLAWDKAGGRVVAGLARRRREERALCLRGI